MILTEGHSSEYLKDYLNGDIPMGLGIGCDLDKHLVWKDSQLNICLGHDNVGKTYFMEWYFLALATNHNLKFCFFMDENFAGEVMRDLIQMYTKTNFKDLTYREMKKAELVVSQWFKFIDNKRRYTPTEILQLFFDSECDNLLIDPFNGLDTPFTYSDNYRVLNDMKLYTKQENKTIYINAHPASASGRRGAVYPKDHEWSGHVQPPLKSDIEGGKPFANKSDDFIICHRLTQSQTMWKYTMIEVAKIKRVSTGGKPTFVDLPVMLDYNFGLGFTCGGIDCIKRK